MSNVINQKLSLTFGTLKSGLIGFVSVLMAGHSTALASDTYICGVKVAYSVSDGQLQRHPLASEYEGEVFTVDRQTGDIAGSAFTSANWLGRREVLDYGSKQQSFKLVFVTPPYVSVRLLIVNEFDEGANKQFFLTDNSNSYTGFCHHGQ